jgi:hypothetical protein
VSDQHAQEQRTEEAIKVRQVTDVHANFNEGERGEPGKFSFQFILDDGAEEYVLRPTAQDAEVIRDLIKDADELFFDMERRVLILRDLDRREAAWTVFLGAGVLRGSGLPSATIPIRVGAWQRNLPGPLSCSAAPERLSFGGLRATSRSTP